MGHHFKLAFAAHCFKFDHSACVASSSSSSHHPTPSRALGGLLLTPLVNTWTLLLSTLLLLIRVYFIIVVFPINSVLKPRALSLCRLGQTRGLYTQQSFSSSTHPAPVPAAVPAPAPALYRHRLLQPSASPFECPNA